MKKKLLFTLIGGIIIFIWQFLSFAIINLHEPAMQYTSAQDEILQKLEELNLEEGMYFLGQPDPALPQEEREQAMEKYAGKSFGILNYHHEMMMDMTMPLIRGIVVDFLIAWLLFWVFLQLKEKSIKICMFISLSIGFIVFLSVPYTNYIWYMEPDIYAYIVDGIVPWVILGFLGNKMAK